MALGMGKIIPAFFNTRRMRTRVTVVCLSVTTLLPAQDIYTNFAQNSKGFQLRDFVKNLSLTSYSLFFVFSIAKSAIF